MTDYQSFVSRLSRLYNITGGRLPELTPSQRHEFIVDPPRYFLRTDDEQREAIWREIQRRQCVPADYAIAVGTSLTVEAMKERRLGSPSSVGVRLLLILLFGAATWTALISILLALFDR